MISRLKAGTARQQKARPSNARSSKTKLSWGEKLQWLTRSLSLLLVVAVLVGVAWGGEKLFHKLDVPIGVISVKGQFSHVDQVEVQRRVEPLINGGILSLNLEQIRGELELHPWIEQAKVSRQWPGGLVITVKEEVPIARWGGADFMKTGFVNSRGELLEIVDSSSLVHLPLLQGDVDTERLLMKSYREMAHLLQPSNLKIAGLKRDQRGAWQLSLSNGLELVIGRDQVMEKMRRFLVVWMTTLKGKAEQIARVDIRYDNGISVEWTEKAMQERTLQKQALREFITIAPDISGQV
jgi:cell division protein FtsQ